MSINKSIRRNSHAARGHRPRHHTGEHKRKSQEKRPFQNHRQLTLAGSPPPSPCTAALASSGSALVLIWKAKDKLHFFFQKKAAVKMISTVVSIVI